jgi:hypothetical protein
MSSRLANWLFKSRLALTVATGGLVVASTTAGIVLNLHTSRDTAVKGEKFVKTPAGGSAPDGTGNTGSRSAPANAFTMTVQAVGTIAPGQRQTLNVTVSNPNGQNMAITGANGVVDSVSKPGCLPSWFTVEDWAPGASPTIAPANGSTVIHMKLDFADLPTNQDVCKSTDASPVTIALTFHATGTQA